MGELPELPTSFLSQLLIFILSLLYYFPVQSFKFLWLSAGGFFLHTALFYTPFVPTTYIRLKDIKYWISFMVFVKDILNITHNMVQISLGINKCINLIAASAFPKAFL